MLIRPSAAIRLQGDDEIAAQRAGETEDAGGDGGIVLRRAPCFVNACDEIRGERGNQAFVIREREVDGLGVVFQRPDQIGG